MRYQPGSERKVGERTTGGHHWKFMILRDGILPPRAAQQCTLCNMVRVAGPSYNGLEYDWYYRDEDGKWNMVAPEPPCTILPQKRAATHEEEKHPL